MMEHADRVDIVEPHQQREIIDVTLDDMDIGKLTGIVKCNLDGFAEIDTDNFTRAELGRAPGMATFTTAGIEDQFTAKEVSRYWSDPIEKLLFVELIEMGK